MKQLVQLVSQVNSKAIRRERNGRGDVVYIVPSYTLPDNVVMNGGLYPAQAIADSFESLEGVPAPIGHPYDANGNYVSATSEDGLNYFYAGVVNKNVRRVSHPEYGHRVYVEKHITVKVANETERGRALIEAIDEGKPIHTSTGIMVERLKESGVNDKGEAYTWKVGDMIFDHDAILLDTEGAATPEDGVGMLVNHQLIKEVTRDGKRLQVNTATAPSDPAADLEEQINQNTRALAAEKNRLAILAGNQSMRDLEAKVRGAIQDVIADAEWSWLEDWGHDYAVIEAGGENYRVAWFEDENGDIQITGDPEPVKRVTTWETVKNAAKRLFHRGNNAANSNQPDEGAEMAFKELIENALKQAGKDTTNMSEEAMLKAYQGLAAPETQANSDDGKTPSGKPKGEPVVNEDLLGAIETVVTRVVDGRFAANAADAEKAERAKLAETLKANEVELSEDEQKSMSVNALRVLADKSAPKADAHGLPGASFQHNSESSLVLDDLPE